MSFARKSCVFWPWAMPAKAQYLPFKEDAREHQHVRQKPRLAQREPPLHHLRDLSRPGTLTQVRRYVAAHMKSSATRGSNGRPPLTSAAAVTGESSPRAAGGMAAAVVIRDHLDVFVTVSPIELVLEAEIGKMDRLVEVRQVVLARPLLDFARVPVRSPVTVRTAAVVLLEPLLVLALEIVLQDDATDVRAFLAKPLLGTQVRADTATRRASARAAGSHPRGTPDDARRRGLDDGIRAGRVRVP